MQGALDLSVIGRNHPCPCGSGKKQKRCCMQRVVETRRAVLPVGELLRTAFADQQAGRVQEAEASYRRILQLEPNHPDALRNLGVLAQHAGRCELALCLVKRAVDANPANAACFQNMGDVFLAQGKAAEAVLSYTKAIALKPGFAEAHNNLGLALKTQGKLEAACARFQQAILYSPNDPAAHNNLGITLFELGRSGEAANSYAQALALAPQHAAAHYNLGIALNACSSFDQACISFRKALSIQPESADAWNNLGIALAKLGKLDEAVASYTRAIELKPECAAAYNNLAMAHFDMGRTGEAVAGYAQAIACNPEYAEAYYNLGIALKAQGKYDEAIRNYHRAIELKANPAEAYNNLGLALYAQGKPDEAVASLTQALALKPDSVEACTNLGFILHSLGRPDEAYACSQRALALQPDCALAYTNLIFTHAYMHDIPPEEGRALAAGWEKAVLCESDRDAAQARRYAFKPRATGKLRLGIVSAELGEHAVAEFLEPVLAALDRSRIRVTLYPTVCRSGARAERLKALADEWMPLTSLPDAAAAAQIRAQQIDVLIDTTGHTSGCRLGIFAHRAAPVQCHYIGSLSTSGLAEMDWFIADRDLLPDACNAHFREAIWRLPRPWLAYRGDRSLPESAWQPDAQGAIWLGSFNNSDKVRQDACRLWAKALCALPQSKLLLKDRATASESVRQRILGELGKHGVASQRVEFATRTPDWNAHMALYDRIDIALDPIPLNSGTTAFDALWMGAPLVSLESDWMGGRMGSAILRALGRPEWVARTEEEYVAIVTALARDVEGRRAMRREQRALMAASPLCDAQGLARALEDAFEEMLDDWAARAEAARAREEICYPIA